MSQKTVWITLTTLLVSAPASLLIAEQPRSPITAIAVTPDGEQVVFARNQTLFQCRWDHLNQIQTLKTRVDRILKLRFTTDGKKLIIAGGTPGESGTMEILDLTSQRPVWYEQLHDDVIYDFDLHGDSLVTASHDQSCKIADRTDGGLQGSFQGHSRPVTGVRFLGKQVISVGVDHSIRVWDSAQNHELRNLDNHRAAINGLVVWDQPVPGSPGSMIDICCTISNDKTIRFWQPVIGRLVRFYQLQSGKPLCLTHALNQNGVHEVCVGTDDGRIITVDYRTARLQFSRVISSVGIEAIAKHPAKQIWITGDAAGILKVTPDPRDNSR